MSPLKSIRVLLLAVLVASLGGSSSARLTAKPAPLQNADDIAPSALAQIDALLQEKESRTAVQRKMDSQLLYGLKMTRGQPIALGVRTLASDLPYQPDRRVSVDVTADVGAPLLDELRSIGVEIVHTDQVHRSLRLLATLDQVERIAALPQVIFVQPQQHASTASVTAPPSVRRLDRQKFAMLLRGAAAAQVTSVGSKTSEGDVTHKAVNARATFNIDGTGVKIGVLSDGVRNLAASQASGDLGPVTVLGNGNPCPAQNTCDEGTAMLEIVHDLAPGAQLFFATAFTGLTQFAQNIRDLRAAGCDIIVDDVFYDVETPFQDGQAPGVISTTNGGVVIQAVKDVTAAGALYFSSAGNSGNFTDGTSGVWEGDFVDGGAATAPLGTGRVHNFGAQTFNVVTAAGMFVNLYWSDPLGGSSNDYDLFRLDSTGANVLASSTNIQSGTQDPYELINAVSTGDRIVIVKSNAAASRFLHLDTNRGRLTFATPGATHGHSATSAANSFGVAATPALAAFPNPFNSTDRVETFSSDGPRRIFFTASGTQITPGNVSATGGQVLNKPDITAADGVSVTGVGGFSTTFFGTSAAAPHAGAIAALVKSLNPAATASQIRSALLSSVIDIEAAGVDRNSGAGIIMADTAMNGIVNAPFLVLGTVVPSENPGNGNGAINPGEGAKLVVPLVNAGLVGATGVSATLATSTPGVILTQPTQVAFPNISAGASATSPTPFLFTMASNAACPLTIDFTLAVTFAGGSATLSFQVLTGPPPFTVTTTLDGVAPAGAPGVTAATGVQVGRLTRNAPASSCAAPKTAPTPFDLTGDRQFDAYSINTCNESVASCATVQLTSAGGSGLFSVAYAPSFVPANLQSNYKADPGGSATTVSYSMSVAAGAQNLAIVVHELNPGAALGTQYTLTVSGLCAGLCATPNQVPVARATSVTVVAGAGGTANASVDNGSFDPDGDVITLTQSPAGPYAIGTTSVLLTATDPKGATTQATGSVTVLARPTIATIASQAIPQNTSTGPLAFTVGDMDTPVGSLTMSGLSSNTTLVPVNNIVFGGSGANRTVTVTPAAAQTGTTTITLTVSDGLLTASTAFDVTVSSTASGGTVTAHVVDAASGAPLAGASITFTPGGFVTTTDGSGNTSLLIPSGVYTLSLSALGHALQAVFGVIVTPGSSTPISFTVAPGPAPIGNVVLNNSAIGDPADGATATSVAGETRSSSPAVASRAAPPSALGPGELAATSAALAPSTAVAPSPTPPVEIASSAVTNDGGATPAPDVSPLSAALNRAAVSDPRLNTGSNASGSVFQQSSTSAATSASDRKWEFEVHGGWTFGRSSGGTSALPGPGAPFVTAASTPSRRESSWFFGDGALLLNQVNTALAVASKITPLDSVLGTSALEPGGGGVFGVRVSRVITPRLTAEWTADYGFSRLALSSNALAGLESSRASFISAWSGLASAGSFTNPAVTAVSTLHEGGTHRLLTTGVVNVALRRDGTTIPYVTLGGGLRFYAGDKPTATLVGNYQFVVSGVPISERDSATVRFAAPHAIVVVIGGGLKHNLSPRMGVRLDLRAFLGRSSIATLVNTSPSVSVLTPAGSAASATSPSIQFSNNPTIGVQSSLSGPPISGVQTFGSAFETEISVTSGIFWRF